MKILHSFHKCRVTGLLAASIAGSLTISRLSASPNNEPLAVVWEAPTPSGLANSIMGVGWSTGTGEQVAMGSTDRWVRTRDAVNGNLRWSALQPIRSGSADQTIFSTDNQFLAVHNSSGGLGFRVHRAGDGVFLGTITVTFDSRGLVVFGTDAALAAAMGPGALTQWRLADFRVVKIEGTGYDKVKTVFNFSPDGSYQSTASEGRILILRRADGAVVRELNTGDPNGSGPVTFTPNSTGVAVWTTNPNTTTLWRIVDGVATAHFPGAVPQEGVTAIRFSANGARLVTTGYLPHEDPVYGWQQTGIIRFWNVTDGSMQHQFTTHTGIAVTSPIAWSPDETQFAFGTYEGAVVVARTPPAAEQNAGDPPLGVRGKKNEPRATRERNAAPRPGKPTGR